MQKKSVRRLPGLYMGISISTTLAALGVVALRHALETPQPLRSSLPGEALLYSWRRRSVFYTVLGPLGAPPLVLFHTPGIGASAQHTQQLIEALAQTFRVYAPDLPGFGLSDRPDIPYSALVYTEFCQDFLRDVVRKPAILIASQLSCNYAIATAASTPELCTALALISPYALQRERPSGLFQALVEQPLIKALLYPLLSTRLAFLLMRRGRQTDFARFYALTHQLGAEHAAMALLAGKLNQNMTGEFASLHQPVLLIWGTQALEDQHHRALLRSSPQNIQARTVELMNGAGLTVEVEQPERVASAILSWYAEKARPLTLTSGEGPEESISALTESMLSSLSPGAANLLTREPESEELPAFIELETVASAEEQESPQPAAPLAYCVKCRKKTEMRDASEFIMKNGRLAARGTCTLCGSSITRIGGLR